MKPNWKTIIETQASLEQSNQNVTNGEKEAVQGNNYKKIKIFLYTFIILFAGISYFSINNDIFTNVQIASLLDSNPPSETATGTQAPSTGSLENTVSDENFSVNTEGQNTESTPPPAAETTPPAEETPPPAAETTPPVAETPPPAEETPPPAAENQNTEEQINNLFGNEQAGGETAQVANPPSGEISTPQTTGENTDQNLGGIFRENSYKVSQSLLDQINSGSVENLEVNQATTEQVVSSQTGSEEGTLHSASPQVGILSGILHKNIKGKASYYLDTEESGKIFLETTRNLDSVVGKEILVHYSGNKDKFTIDKIKVPGIRYLNNTGPTLNIALIAIISIILSIVIQNRKII